MHGRKDDDRRERCHMWSVPAPGTSARENQVVIPHPPAPPAVPVQPQLDSFLKQNERKIQVGDCALFKSGNAPPFIGIIQCFSTGNDISVKLCVNWLYRSADIKLTKGILLEAAPNEVFYSFHKDIISAASLLHPCKVAFLRTGVDLPLGVSSFICRRVYDTSNKRLWWLTDKNYINEHQEEVDQLLDKTSLEMHAAVQSGGRSPTRLNGPMQQLKSGSNNIRNSGTFFTSQVKGKKRDRGDQAIEPFKRERISKVGGHSTCGMLDNNVIKSELSQISENGALINADGVEKLVQLMQVDNGNKIDLTDRVLLADVITATDNIDCLNKFVQARGVPVLDEWLQKAHKGKTGDGNSPKESDKAIEELLLALLRALDKLPVNLHALQTCNIGKSVNHLRSHKNLEVQKKARILVDTWKKRVDAEMKTSDAKPAGISQAVTWQVKPGSSEVSHSGNLCNGSGELSMKSSIFQQSTCKGLNNKPVYTDTVKLATVIVTSGKLQSSSLEPLEINSKDSLAKVAVGSGALDMRPLAAKEEKSSGSSQSCSIDHGRTAVSSLKEDAKRSTTGSVNANKTFGCSFRYLRSSNGFMDSNSSGGQKESALGKLGLHIRNSVSEKVSQPELYCEKTLDVSASEHGSSHRLIVRLPNAARSPTRSRSGGSLEVPLAGSGGSSPGVLDKHEQGDRKVIGRNDTGQALVVADVGAESWQRNNDVEEFVGCEEGDKLSMIVPTDEARDETARIMDTPRSACSCNGKGASVAEPSFSSMNALIEGCAKYSEVTTSSLGGDDIGMDLLASVATGEMSKSNGISPASSPLPATEDHRSDAKEAKPVFSFGDLGSKNVSPSKENIDSDSLNHEKGSVPVFTKDEIQVVAANFSGDSKSTEDIGLLSDVVEEEFVIEDAIQNQDDRRIDCVTKAFRECKSMVRSQVYKTKPISSSSAKITEISKFCSNSGGKSLFHGVVCEGSASSRDVGKVVILESSLRHNFDKDIHVGAFLTEQNQHCNAKAETEMEKSSSAADEVPCRENTDLLSSKKFDGLDVQCLERTGKFLSAILPSNHIAHGGSVSSPHGMANDARITDRKASMKHGTVSDDRDQLPTIHNEARECARIPADDSETKVELAPSVEIFSFVTTTEHDAGAKVDFDLNEGILVDDVNQSEPLPTTTLDCSPGIRISSLTALAFPLTVASPAKGPFVPPEIVLKNKGELGWKGSASTSAFRPAERRKVLEMSFNTFDVPSSNTTMPKHGRPLEFDLNIPNERALENMSSQKFAQTTGSESGVISNHGVLSQITGGLDLDLNRIDEGTVNSQFLASTRCRFEVPLLHAGLKTVGFSKGEAIMSRNFDLNRGPGIDDVSPELFSRNQKAKICNNMLLVSPFAGLGMNKIELGSGWLPPGNSYPAVVSPSFLHDRGEQSYPIVTAPGAQRFVGPITGTGAFGSEMYQGPLLSSYPAMGYSPAATAFSYTGLPFSANFPLACTSFSAASTNYIDSSSGRSSYFSPIPSPLVGATCAVSSSYARPYVINHPEGSGTAGYERSKNWGRQGLDLNAGLGTVEEVKDDRLLSSSRQLHAASSQSFVEDQTRLFHVSGGVLKRKEPDGSWGPEKFNFKQPSWH